MSVALNFDHLKTSLHDDLKRAVELLGTEPELPSEPEVWDEAISIITRVRDVCCAAQMSNMHDVSKLLLAYVTKLRNNQLPDPNESAERLLAAMIVMAEQPLSIATAAGNDSSWLPEIKSALHAEAADAAPSKILQLAGVAYAPVIQSAFLSLHQGNNITQALSATAASYGRLAKAANEGPGLLQQLAALAECLRLGLISDERKAMKSLSLGASLLRKRLSSKRDGEAEIKLRERCVTQLSTVVDTGDSHWLGVLRQIESTQTVVSAVKIWRPKLTLVPMASSLNGLADALREELAYVIEALDVNSRVAVGAGQDTIMLSHRVTHCANILQAAGIENWATELHKQADAVLRAATRMQCMNAAERIEDLVARLEPEVLETWLNRQEDQRQEANSKQVVAAMARTAVIESSISCLNRFAARLELVATDATRDGSHVSNANLAELKGAATIMNWREVTDILRWMDQHLAQTQSMPHGDALSDVMDIAVNASTAIVQYLQNLRMANGDHELMLAELNDAMARLVPEYNASAVQ